MKDILISSFHQCFWCGERYMWSNKKTTDSFVVKAHLIATSRDRNTINFDAISECPTCGMSNKYEHEETLRNL